MDELAAYERGFRRAGLPLLIEDYSAREDVFTRAVPILSLVFLAEALGAVDLRWSVLANLGAVAGGLAIVVVAMGALNRGRGVPFLSRPREVGRTELVGFVIVPALLPLVFGGQWRSALVTAAGNLALLGLVYAVVGYGLASIVRWAAARFLSQLVASFDLLTRALPLLLIFSVVLFLTTEMWQVFGAAPRGFLAVIFGSFVAMGVVFLAGRLPREVRRLEHDAGAGGPPLEPRQRRNVALVLFISQGLQVLVVAASIGAFFALFGALAVPGDVQGTWLGHAPNDLLRVHLLGGTAMVSEELLRVAGAIAAFSGLYYAIAVLTDSTYREEFLEEVTGEMRDTFAARARYLALRGASAGP
ncbi:MAG: hypothetical protein QOE65_1638 [Solirubrobacteraceae bacterium]|jgi:hypothetical protein|nr:hypothetical protein [Solirubrobacteraceae bacterium]